MQNQTNPSPPQTSTQSASKFAKTRIFQHTPNTSWTVPCEIRIELGGRFCKLEAESRCQHARPKPDEDV
eukprot:1782276-Rhodomonas_salina.3